MGLTTLVGTVGRAVRAIWRGAIRGPVALARWIRANPSRAIAIVWLAGMATFVAITTRRAYRQYRRDEAVRIAEARPEVAGHGPEVVEMMDVDEIEKIEVDRMHANGLGAAGEGTEVDQATIDGARESRAHIAAVEGARVGGAGDVIVVTKGGIAGWIARNKDKKADPETLAWLRAEEAQDGRAAYASWANGDNSIMGWLERGKQLHHAGSAAPTSGSGSAPPPIAGSGSAPPPIAASGSASPPKPTAPAPNAGSGSAQPSGFDLEALGMAAYAAIRPVAAVPELPAPTPDNIDELRARLPTSGGAARLEIAIRAQRIVISSPSGLLFARGATELSPDGKALVHQLAAVLGTVAHRGFQIIAADGTRAMEVAGTLAIAGLPADRLSLAVAADPEQDRIDIALIAEAP